MDEAHFLHYSDRLLAGELCNGGVPLVLETFGGGPAAEPTTCRFCFDVVLSLITFRDTTIHGKSVGTSSRGLVGLPALLNAASRALL